MSLTEHMNKPILRRNRIEGRVKGAEFRLNFLLIVIADVKVRPGMRGRAILIKTEKRKI